MRLRVMCPACVCVCAFSLYQASSREAVVAGHGGVRHVKVKNLDCSDIVLPTSFMGHSYHNHLDVLWVDHIRAHLTPPSASGPQ